MATDVARRGDLWAQMTREWRDAGPAEKAKGRLHRQYPLRASQTEDPRPTVKDLRQLHIYGARQDSIVILT